jgi:hypothetical protein
MVLREIEGEAGGELAKPPERHRQIWMVQVDVPARELRERKPWRHTFYVAAFDADEARDAVMNSGDGRLGEGCVVNNVLPLSGIIGGGSTRLQQWPHK